MWYLKDKEYKENLPEYYHNIKEINVLNNILNDELDRIRQYTEDIFKNVIVVTSEDKGLKRFEKIFRIQPLARDTIISRRNKIIAELMDRPPINEEKIKNIAESYLGGDVKVLVTKEGYTYKITYRNYETLLDVKPLKLLLRKILPANIDFDVIYGYVDWLEISSNTWEELSLKTWDNVRIGG